MKLRDYQQTLVDNVLDSFIAGGHRAVCAVLPTGGGKTAVFSHIVSMAQVPAWVVAHRQELVVQMSTALARFGVQHNILAPKNTIRYAVREHQRAVGESYYDPAAPHTAAGVDTLIRRVEKMQHTLDKAGLVVMDEAHHVLKDNKWGTCAQAFRNAKLLGVTANTIRADGRGIGRHADGLFDVLHVGATMRELVNAGHLTDYRIFAPQSDLNVEGLKVGANGDYNPKGLKARAKESHIVGDVVGHYKKLAYGKRGVTFATDVETAVEIARKYNDAGVPAAAVHAGTDPLLRSKYVQQLGKGELLQLVNVDIFGEGFDLPAIEVVSMARPTQSFNLYCQQFGRALRPMEGKSHAIIIDHVSNVIQMAKRYGLPDSPIKWSLDRREKRVSKGRDPDLIPQRVCDECTATYEAVLPACPHCSTPYVPQGRSTPEQVDGDLLEMSSDLLNTLRAEIERVDSDPNEVGERIFAASHNKGAALGAAKQHRLRQLAQTHLREAISLWGGLQRSLRRPDSESYKRFYFKFGVDVLTAQTLGRRDAEDLMKRIYEDLQNDQPSTVIFS